MHSVTAAASAATPKATDRSFANHGRVEFRLGNLRATEKLHVGSR